MHTVPGTNNRPAHIVVSERRPDRVGYTGEHDDCEIIVPHAHEDMAAPHEEHPVDAVAAQLMTIVMPSKADYEAARRIFGTTDPDVRTMRTWYVPSVSPHGPYVVAERRDTVHGGLYLYCECPGWKFQKGKGKDCRHVAQVKAGEAGSR